MRRIRSAFSPLVSRLLWPCLMAFGLTACAGVQAPSSSDADLPTASDQTDTQRRAALRTELAAAYLAAGLPLVALDEVKQALRIDPRLTQALNVRGLAYAALGDPRRAQDSLEQALDSAPGDPASLHNLAWFHCQQGQFPQALAAFDQVLAQLRGPSASRTLLARGVCESRAGRMEAAVRALQSSLDHDPSNSAAAINLAAVLEQQGRLQLAAVHARRVNGDRAARNPESLWLGARIERRLGHEAAAQALLETLHSRFPQSPQALAVTQGSAP